MRNLARDQLRVIIILNICPTLLRVGKGNYKGVPLRRPIDCSQKCLYISPVGWHVQKYMQGTYFRHAFLTSHHLCSKTSGVPVVPQKVLLYDRRRFSPLLDLLDSMELSAKTDAVSLSLAFTIREIREQDEAWTRSSLLERPARTDRRGLRCSRASASTSTAASRRRMEGVAAGCEFYRIHTLTCKMSANFRLINLFRCDLFLLNFAQN